jgi:hypothetical protein
MTLLILLVSIAVLEYVVRRPVPPSPKDMEAGDRATQAVPDLAQLGRAVEQFGRGPAPPTNEPGTPEPAPEERKM